MKKAILSTLVLTFAISLSSPAQEAPAPAMDVPAPAPSMNVPSTAQEAPAPAEGTPAPAMDVTALAGETSAAVMEIPAPGARLALPAVDMNRGTSSFMDALANRKSIRSFATRPLSQQDLSDLLWAAQGKNREDGRMTSPTARNRQEISVYVFTANGVALYDHDTNSLVGVVSGDHRKLIAGPQLNMASAPLALLIVADFAKYGSTQEHAKTMVHCDAGIVSQNISLFCAASGLCTVPRGIMNHEGLVKLLNLSADQSPVLNHPVGFPKD